MRWKDDDFLRYRLRFREAPEMNDLYFEDVWYSFRDEMLGSRLEFRKGLPGVYFYWVVSEVIEAPEGEPDTLVCSMEYNDSFGFT